MKISATIITRNEASRIRPCLDSLKWVDEIVVLDSNSTDDTVKICREYTDKVFETDWPGFGIQKQRAVDLASHQWILSIDADERVSEELKKEIQQTIGDSSKSGYFLPRLSYLCDQPVRHCGWYPDYIVRLFKKEKGRFTQDLVHEQIVVDGELGRLKNHLLHYSYEDFKQFIQKFNHYSSLGAIAGARAGKRAGVFKAFVRGIIAFFKIYVFKMGFLDGSTGLIVAVSAFESSYYKYIKLWHINKNPNELMEIYGQR